MTKQEMINLLNAALEHERKHFNFYLQSMLTLRGHSRLFFLHFLEKEMHGELEHIRLFGDKIAALGGTPTTTVPEYPNSLTCMKDILNTAISFEREVLAFYHSIYPKAEEYASLHQDMSIVLLLEEQIEDSTKDVEEMEKMFHLADGNVGERTSC
jgi:bacterioferritin (cytochrome b1)